MKYYNKEIETMSRENLFALQSERLVKQVQNVYDRVPYYRAKMDAIGLKPEDIGSISDISKLPFTVKTDIRANYPFGLFGCDRKKVVRLHASSGTTGKLTVVGYTKRDLNTWAECCARAMTSAGLTKNDTVHIAYGYGLFTGGLGLHYGVRCPNCPPATGAVKSGADETVPAETPGHSSSSEMNCVHAFSIKTAATAPKMPIFVKGCVIRFSPNFEKGQHTSIEVRLKH